ncbi:MAG: polysaccharide deacetylase family protein [Armatimonadota bacterium]|nr:polysaccharide deacetylase family protein [Armatimonadota bacterium]
MQFAMTVDDVCMPGFSSEEHLGRWLDLLAELDIRATFFVVPLADKTPLANRPGYVALLRRALAEGHEVAQHGLEHDRFEVGIPPPMVLNLPHEGPARERLARERDAIEAAHSVPRIRELLANGRHLLEDAVGVRPVGFRAPCLQTCANLFTALAEEGYRYDSSFPIQEAGWDLIMGDLGVARHTITRARFEASRQDPRLISLPMTTDYTWYLAEDRYAATWEMAKSDALDCLRENVPLVPLSHVSPFFEGDGDCGERLFRELVAFTRDAAASVGQTCEFIPLAEVKV